MSMKCQLHGENGKYFRGSSIAWKVKRMKGNVHHAAPARKTA